MDAITYLPPDLWLIIIEKLAVAYGYKKRQNVLKCGMSPAFCNMRLVCRLFRNLSMKVTWKVFLTKTKMFTEKMDFFRKIYHNKGDTRLPPFGFPKCMFVYWAKNRQELMAIKNKDYSHLFSLVNYEVAPAYHNQISNDILSLKNNQTVFWLKNVTFLTHLHIAGDHQTNMQMINMEFRQLPPSKLYIETTVLFLNERDLMLKQPQSLNEYNGLSIGAYVPKCKFLCITAGYKSIDDGTHRCFVDKFNLVEKVDRMFPRLNNYIHVHNVLNVSLQYITIVNFEAFLHMFPKLKNVALGSHVGKKALFKKYLESRNIKVFGVPKIPKTLPKGNFNH